MNNKDNTNIADWNETTAAGARCILKCNDVEYAFRFCPAGRFVMGSPESELGRFKKETIHNVELTRGFWILETEVTQKMWRSLVGRNPSFFVGDDLPVEEVSWFDCQHFIDALNSMNAAPQDWRFSLPTEAQWEYMARAGSSTPFPWGNELNGDRANCDGTSPYGTNVEGAFLNKTTPVAKYEPNAWGVYDAQGNVWEWTLDVYQEYPQEDAVNPINNAESNTVNLRRVVRGGSWRFDARGCRSAFRNDMPQYLRYDDLGFRLALVQE